jgi:succinyl-CoA synthetase beta subunit
MKLLEYEAKALLYAAGVPIPPSVVINREYTPELTLPTVLKSQVPIGGRGKLGGVVVVENPDDVTTTIDQLFARDIRGYLPNALLAEDKLAISQEYYFSIVINKSVPVIELVAHKNGGVEVEANDHDSFLHIPLTAHNAEEAGERLAEYLDLPGQSFALQDLVEHCYDCFVQNDATLLEINPLVLTADNKLIAGDCKMVLDDAALFRHPDWKFEDTPSNTNFVVLDEHGTIATIANGAGLAMATVDAVATAGMKPANFLDIGGGANTASVLAAFERIMEFSSIKGIVINIFAGITRCDEVAKAIIAARQQISDLPPLFIRLAGTNFEAAAELLAKENIAILPTLEECLSAAKEVSHE